MKIIPLYAPGTQRRFQKPPTVLDAVEAISSQHPSAIFGRTKFVARVRPANPGANVLVSGHNNRKIGKIVTKGSAAGLPIYTLTLEERATCPQTCRHWLDCYGNKMHWPHRWSGPAADLVATIDWQLATLTEKHRRGLIVRLHVLGDFQSVEYVQGWARLLDRHRKVRVWGYTQWPHNSEVGRAIKRVAVRFGWSRFAVRFSNSPLEKRSANTIDYRPETPTVDGAIVCPEQVGKVDCCATCGLCWNTERNILFLHH